MLPVLPTRSPVEPQIGPLAFIDYKKTLQIRDNAGVVCSLTAAGKAAGIAASPAWSPDGTRLAYSYQADEGAAAELRLVDLQTGEQTVAWTDPDAGSPQTLPIREIAWSPSGRYMAFEQGCCPVGSLSLWDLQESALAGTFGALRMFWMLGEDRLTLTLPEPLEQPIPVGSGTSFSIALVRPYEISPTVVLTGTAETLYSARAWLPGETLLYRRYDLTAEGKTEEQSWWTARMADGEAVERQKLDAPPLAYDDERLEERLPARLYGAMLAQPTWSPEGTWVVFRARLGEREPWRIYAFHWKEGRLVGPLGEGTDLALSPARSEWRCRD